MTDETLTIDVVSDVVCPWCYIGKRRLETALRDLETRTPGLATQVLWHPFQLNPDLPADGVDRKSYLDAKFGGAARADQIYARVRAAAADAGVELALDSIVRQPNTLRAHRLIAWAQADGRDAGALVERLFRAYFVEGRMIGEIDTLAELAGEAGLDADAARDLLASGRLRDEVAAADERERALGIDGVPFFVFDGKVALSGAHEPATLLDAIAEARGG